MTVWLCVQESVLNWEQVKSVVKVVDSLEKANSWLESQGQALNYTFTVEEMEVE